ncbi:HEPN domain-containing protein [Paenirhodobacter populi]|uniref:hypothetical protein n=1 Tax=Paenirhodobacter populi TaxID=2306993 RepID=UPI000FE2E784|nr:hypothetical protein [Sinirhodobacter populi]
MREAKVIGSHLKLACENLLTVKKISPSDRVSPTLMFYAAENLLMAVFTSEGIDAGAARRKAGNHQLDRMLDELPEECAVKAMFEGLIDLVAYSTTYRYPTPVGDLPLPPSKEDAERYFSVLKEVLGICTVRFKVDVRLDAPVAGSIKPLR